MELAIFKIGKKIFFLQKIYDLSNGLYVTLVLILAINEDVIQVNNDKDIEFLGQNFIDIALEADRSVRYPKKITWYLKWPYWVLKAVFHSSPFFILI